MSRSRLTRATSKRTPSLSPSIKSVVLTSLIAATLLPSPALGHPGPSLDNREPPRSFFLQNPPVAEAFDKAMRDGTDAAAAGNPTGAITAFRRALELEPESFLAHRYLASALLQLERYNDALTVLTAAARLRPLEPSVLYTQALTLTRLERFREAIPYLEKAVTAHPGNTEAWMLLGRLLTQYDGSLEAILRATEAFEHAFEQRPNSVEILLRLTRAYRRIGLYEEALELLDGAATTGSVALSLTLARAQIQMQVGSYQAAHATLSQAIATGAGALTYYQLGIVERNLGGLDAAQASLETATRLRPRLIEAILELGNLLIVRQEFAAAKETLQRAVEVAPENAEAHNLLGLARLRAGDASSAVPYFERALALDPTLANAIYNLALGLRDLGRIEQSRGTMDRFAVLNEKLEADEITENRSTEIAIVNGRGLYYYRHGDSERAREIFEQALELSPEDGLVHFNLGLTHAALGNHAQAVVAFERAIEINPTRPNAYAALAVEYRALGREEDAARMLARYRELRRDLPGW